MTSKVNKMREALTIGGKSGSTDAECKGHSSQVFSCEKNSVYQIALTCGKSYIGETLRCPNVRLEEHMSLKAKYATFTEHKEICKCSVLVDQCRILSNGPIKGAYVRKLTESLMIEEQENEKPNSVISKASMIPTEWERKWFERARQQRKQK